MMKIDDLLADPHLARYILQSLEQHVRCVPGFEDFNGTPASTVGCVQRIALELRDFKTSDAGEYRRRMQEASAILNGRDQR